MIMSKHCKTFSQFKNLCSITLSCLLLVGVVLLSVIYRPSYADNHLSYDNQNSQTEASKPTPAQPDNIFEYAKQELGEVEDIDPTQALNPIFDPSEKNAVEQAGYTQGDIALTGEYNANYYLLNELNNGLPSLSKPPNLSTPLATLEFFQSAVMNQQYDLAAYALNMNLIDEELQQGQSLELVKRLDFLLSRRQLYVFDDLPDRPDGLIEPLIGSSSSVTGIPRRSIQLGYIEFRERHVPIFIERVRVGEQAPIWVFSSQTVGNIDNLYEQYHPAQFERYLPLWLTSRFFGIAIWEFCALILFFVTTLGLGWLLSKAVSKLIDLNVSEKEDKKTSVSHKSINDMADKLTVPMTFMISFSLVYALVSGRFPYLDAVATTTRPIIWIALVLSTVWLGIRVINFFANRYQDLQIDRLGEQEFDKYRRRLTYLSIFRRFFIFIMILGSIWIGLSEFTDIEGLGRTLLTSAGIAGVVIGIAAQPILGNIVAGMQVAITQPVRIGDTVMMNDNWSTVEDLRYTYAVLKTWDKRRLFVPMRYFVTDVVENWSHPDSNQIRPVHLYIDYGADIAKIRQKFIDVVESHRLWDGETEPALLVIAVSEERIELRGTLAANSPDEAWVLECETREMMLAYIFEEHRAYLPVERLKLNES